MKKHRCELCGSPVKVVGKTTMHYEPDLPTEEEIREILKGFGVSEMLGQRYKLARALYKRIHEVRR